MSPRQQTRCCGPGGQEISIDCCTAGAQQKACGRRMRAVPRCQRTQKTERRLAYYLNSVRVMLKQKLSLWHLKTTEMCKSSWATCSSYLVSVKVFFTARFQQFLGDTDATTAVLYNICTQELCKCILHTIEHIWTVVWSRDLYRLRWVTPSRWYLAGITRTSLTTHPRARQVQSGMPGSPVAVRAGASLLGRRLPSRVWLWQHSALSVVSWRFDLRGAANTQQLWRQKFCSRGTSPVELSSSPAA